MSDISSIDPRLLDAFRRAVRGRIEADLAREAEARAHARATVIPKVAEALEAARREGRVGRAWLFGSFAWGEPGERSDVDLLVEDVADPFDLAGEVGAACGREVHVVPMSKAPDSLVERATGEGILL